MSAAHTPGPWGAVPMVNGSKGGFYIVGNRHGNNAETEVATVGPTLSKSAEANARLIAAAPALLEALGWLESYLRDTPHHNAPAAANARAAISLAKGESA